MEVIMAETVIRNVIRGGRWTSEVLCLFPNIQIL